MKLVEDALCVCSTFSAELLGRPMGHRNTNRLIRLAITLGCLLASSFSAKLTLAQSSSPNTIATENLPESGAVNGFTPQDQETIRKWIHDQGIPLNLPETELTGIRLPFSELRVVGLGEATHGQHEVFELKRQITMHLIRNHGFRLVAYEASVSRMLKANAYIQGSADDRVAAVGGLGMLIWQVEENAKFLDDLREWNRTHEKSEQVRIIGVDAQDLEAPFQQLLLLIGDKHSKLKASLEELNDLAPKAFNQLMNGEREPWDKLQNDISLVAEQLKEIVFSDESTQQLFSLRVNEYLSALTIYRSQGNRDKVMAELLLQQLGTATPGTKCVLWAHNGHIQCSPLRFMGTNELAMGGHLRKSLGQNYYSLGVAFGRGGFQANAKTSEGQWIFRHYQLPDAPSGSLESYFSKSVHPALFIDFRSASDSDAVQRWLKQDHGQRWFGGYGVPENFVEWTSKTENLMHTQPIADFDGLLFVKQTTAATPLDRALLKSDEDPSPPK